MEGKGEIRVFYMVKVCQSNGEMVSSKTILQTPLPNITPTASGQTPATNNIGELDRMQFIK